MMAVKHELEVLITPEGEVRLEIKGMKGPSCHAELESFASGLGSLKSVEKKPEFYQAGQAKKQTQRRD
ncbi:MAG: DUF2997 domain-containing protein [Elusimicrobia bacterium]|nr:DUF2997 domain-containing protein [Elusimicrobiota bacterium]